MDKQNLAYSYYGMSFSHRKRMNYYNTCCNIHELWKYYAKWIKPVTKDFVFYTYDSLGKRNLQKLEVD